MQRIHPIALVLTLSLPKPHTLNGLGDDEYVMVPMKIEALRQAWAAWETATNA
jgi:hypothetical protein